MMRFILYTIFSFSDNVSAHKRLHGGIRFVNELPKTASGKISKKELRQFLKNSGPDVFN